MTIRNGKSAICSLKIELGSDVMALNICTNWETCALCCSYDASRCFCLHLCNKRLEYSYIPKINES